MKRVRPTTDRRERIEALVRELDELLEECFPGELESALERAKKALRITPS